MFGYGFGGARNPRMRALRYGALAVLLLGSVVFRHSGSAYSFLRYGYLALIVSMVVMNTRRRSTGTPIGGTRWMGGGPIGARPQRTDGPPPAPGTVGWLPEPGNPAAEHYWDGSAWTLHRRWDGAGWVQE